MALAQHQNVVQFLCLEQSNVSFYKVLVMEYCDEGNLYNLIKKQPNGLTTPEFIEFSKNLIDAMGHLYQKNVIHRDIKPMNILVSKNNIGCKSFKLGDFGAARVLEHNETFGSLYGTNEYLHPDIFAKFYAKAINVLPSIHKFGYNHELWSLGVTFYEAATGQLPFVPEKGREDPQTMYMMTSQKQTGCISAKQQNGAIKWSKNLPDDCEINRSLKLILPPFLAGLLEVSM